MEYGYARCSTTIDRQDVNRQKMELKKLGVKESNIFWEYESGAKTDRKELNRLFEVVKQGDTIATTEVSRLTRSTKHLCEIMQMVQEKKLLLNIGGSFVVDCREDDIDPIYGMAFKEKEQIKQQEGTATVVSRFLDKRKDYSMYCA